jgi:multidrug resistance protein, MATE family
MIYIWFDTIHGVQSGIIRGLGLQTYGSIYTLVCYYLIGLPLALHFAFDKKMGIRGLWLGYSIACVILDLGFAVIIIYPNWHKIAEKLKKTMEQTGGISSNKVSEPCSPMGYNRAGYSEAHA